MAVKNIVQGQKVTKEKLQRSKELRSEMTPAERILCHELRGNRLGAHFRRQQIIAGFIVDFYCHEAGLVIELDGSIHVKQSVEDVKRDKVLNEMGLRVIRFWNGDIENNLAEVLRKIHAKLNVDL